MLLFNRVVLWDCDRSSNFFSSLPFCTLLWKLLRVFAQGSLKLNPPPPHTQTHTRWNFPYICPPFFHPSLSLYSLLSAQNYKSQTGVHTHTILLLTHTPSLHMLWVEQIHSAALEWDNGVWLRESLFSPRVSSRKPPVCRGSWTDDLNRGPFLSDHGSQELELKEKKSFFTCLFVFLNKKHLFGWSGN